MNIEPVLAIHGGAGTYKKELTPEKESVFEEALRDALKQGQKLLLEGGSALDAVELTAKILEDCPLFNAGKGSVFSHQGTNEMDAAIMDGKTLSAGAVAFVTNIKNPISAARAVMEKTEHVMLVGKGAEDFAKVVGLDIVDPTYFFTQQRWDSWQEIKNQNITELNLGTIGAVARDQFGNLAAATSTGGMNNKKFGRIGDSSIIGAGVYANNDTCAVSSTGHGEYFIRLCTAYDISCLMEYKNLSLESATHEVIKSKMVKLGGTGGVIAIDKDGNVSMNFSTETMFRGFVKGSGDVHPFIFDDYSKIIR
jgi:beta-aspartyl-peptidase (threonine type)